MALEPQAGPVALLLTVLVAAPLAYFLLLLLLVAGGKKKSAAAAAPTSRHDGWRLSLARAHDPVLLLRLGRVPTVVVSSAAAAEEVMRARDQGRSYRVVPVGRGPPCARPNQSP